MSPGLVEDYVSQLERELRRRGIDDPRILAEAREHLLDAVEDGRQRGLPVEEAEREALERFGAPGIVAAHAEEEREHMTGFLGALRRAWQRKWRILAPAALAAIITSVTSYYFMPVRYRSETTILVVPQRVPESYIRSTVTTSLEDRLRSINQRLRSRTKLERIIQDFDLYRDRRETDTMQNIVRDMTDAIDVEIIRGDVFRVAFHADNPRTAKDVTDRLASYFIDENLRDRTELSAMDIDSQIAANVERRQIGEQFRILDVARLPEAPESPNLVRVTIIGALVGLLIGLVLAANRRSSNGGAPPALAEA